MFQFIPRKYYYNRIILSLSLSFILVIHSYSIHSSPSADTSKRQAMPIPPSQDTITTPLNEGINTTILNQYDTVPIGFRPVSNNETRYYEAMGLGYRLIISPSEAWTITRGKSNAPTEPKDSNAQSRPMGPIVTDRPKPSILPVFDQVKMVLTGARKDAEMTGLDEMAGDYNYFFGKDPDRSP